MEKQSSFEKVLRVTDEICWKKGTTMVKSRPVTLSSTIYIFNEHGIIY